MCLSETENSDIAKIKLGLTCIILFLNEKYVQIEKINKETTTNAISKNDNPSNTHFGETTLQ